MLLRGYWFCMVALSVVAPAKPQWCNNPKNALSGHGVGVCPYYYDLLETALLNDSSNLYQLKLAFFPTWDHQVVHVQLNLNVKLLDNEICTNDSGRHRHSTFQPSAVGSWQNTYTWRSGSSLGAIATNVLLTATMYEGIILFVYVLTVPEESLYYVLKHETGPTLTLDLDHLRCNPERTTTKSVVLHLLSWLKQYAVAQKRPETWDESYRGEVDATNRDYQINAYTSVHHLAVAIFVLLNISVMVVIIKVTPGLYRKIIEMVSAETSLRLKKMYCAVYWGGVTVLFFLVIVLFLADLFVLIILFADYIWFASRNIWATVVTVKVIVAVVELIVCIVTYTKNMGGVDLPFKRFVNIYVHVCCPCCASDSRECPQDLKHHVAQTLALWAIVSFVQHLAMSAIPVIFLLILYPGEGFSLLATCLSALFCLIMLVSYMLYMQQVFGARTMANCCAFLATFVVQVLLIISLLSVVITTVVLYITMLGYGASFSGVGGLLVSLIPSATLSAIGWFIKTKLLHAELSREDNTEW